MSKNDTAVSSELLRTAKGRVRVLSYFPTGWSLRRAPRPRGLSHPAVVVRMHGRESYGQRSFGVVPARAVSWPALSLPRVVHQEG